MTSARTTLQIAALSLLLLPRCSGAQSTLDDLLPRLQANLEAYRSSIPSLYCNERAVSRIQRAGLAELKTSIDSVFRLDHRKPPLPDPRLNLIEDHEVKAIDHVPVRRGSTERAGAMSIDGVFSNAISVVSVEMQRCYDYTLAHGPEHQGHATLRIGYHYRPGAETESLCKPLQSSGSALFDAVSLQPLRIEMTVPDVEIAPGARSYGLWRWRIDFVPIAFDGASFQLPDTIHSRLDSEDRRTVWFFESSYSGYHKLAVHSRVLADDPEAETEPRP